MTGRVLIPAQDLVYIRQRNCSFILKCEGLVVLKAGKLLLSPSTLRKDIVSTHSLCFALPHQIDNSEKLPRP